MLISRPVIASQEPPQFGILQLSMIWCKICIAWSKCLKCIFFVLSVLVQRQYCWLIFHWIILELFKWCYILFPKQLQHQRANRCTMSNPGAKYGIHPPTSTSETVNDVTDTIQNAINEPKTILTFLVMSYDRSYPMTNTVPRI